MKTINLSGMGGGYEWTCQKMLENGIKWIKANPDKKRKVVFSGFKNVYGVVVAESPEAKELEKAIMEGIDDATGAMFQCVTGHLRFLAHHNHQEWLDEFVKEPDRFFEFDGTLESCPKSLIPDRGLH